MDIIPLYMYVLNGITTEWRTAYLHPGESCRLIRPLPVDLVAEPWSPLLVPPQPLGVNTYDPFIEGITFISVPLVWQETVDKLCTASTLMHKALE